jgi:hypothetical protein
MPLLQENQTNPNKTNTNQTDPGGFETNNLNKTNPNPKKEESGIIKTIGQLLPLAPFVFEQFTGQKVPQMSGTIAEMQMSLININTNLQTVINNQQSLNQRIANLENSAVQQLTSLTNQFNSLRLTHTQEKKQIELRSNGSDFNKSQQFNPNPNKLEDQEY